MPPSPPYRLLQDEDRHTPDTILPYYDDDLKRPLSPCSTRSSSDVDTEGAFDEDDTRLHVGRKGACARVRSGGQRVWNKIGWAIKTLLVLVGLWVGVHAAFRLGHGCHRRGHRGPPGMPGMDEPVSHIATRRVERRADMCRLHDRSPLFTYQPALMTAGSRSIPLSPYATSRLSTSLSRRCTKAVMSS